VVGDLGCEVLADADSPKELEARIAGFWPDVVHGFDFQALADGPSEVGAQVRPFTQDRGEKEC
jgi:hypothetical protein